MLKKILLVLALTFLYIFLLTAVFENFINRASSTALSVLALLLFVALSFLYAHLIIKIIKNRLL